MDKDFHVSARNRPSDVAGNVAGPKAS